MDDILKQVAIALGTQIAMQGYKKLSAFFAKLFDSTGVLKKVQQVDEPPKKIVVEASEELAKTDDEYLQNCFLKLLKTAYDKEKQHLAHPSFPLILSQLSRDEAFILTELTGGGKVEEYKYMVTGSDGGGKAWNNRSTTRSEFKVYNLFFPHNMPVYIQHLILLNLITINNDKHDSKHETLEGGAIKVCVMRVKYTYELTEFGKLFAQACIPDDIEIESFNYLKKYHPKP